METGTQRAFSDKKSERAPSTTSFHVLSPPHVFMWGSHFLPSCIYLFQCLSSSQRLFLPISSSFSAAGHRCGLLHRPRSRRSTRTPPRLPHWRSIPRLHPPRFDLPLSSVAPASARTTLSYPLPFPPHPSASTSSPHRRPCPLVVHHHPASGAIAVGLAAHTPPPSPGRLSPRPSL